MITILDDGIILSDWNGCFVGSDRKINKKIFVTVSYYDSITIYITFHVMNDKIINNYRELYVLWYKKENRIIPNTIINIKKLQDEFDKFIEKAKIYLVFK